MIVLDVPIVSLLAVLTFIRAPHPVAGGLRPSLKGQAACNAGQESN